MLSTTPRTTRGSPASREGAGEAAAPAMIVGLLAGLLPFASEDLSTCAVKCGVASAEALMQVCAPYVTAENIAMGGTSIASALVGGASMYSACRLYNMFVGTRKRPRDAEMEDSSPSAEKPKKRKKVKRVKKAKTKPKGTQKEQNEPNAEKPMLKRSTLTNSASGVPLTGKETLPSLRLRRHCLPKKSRASCSRWKE